MSRTHDRHPGRYLAAMCCAVAFISVSSDAHEGTQMTSRVIRVYLTAATTPPGRDPSGESPQRTENLERAIAVTNQEIKRHADTLESLNHRLQHEELELESGQWNRVNKTKNESPQKPIDDTLRDLRASFMGEGVLHKKEHVELVERPEEAQLVVEVLGRRKARACAFALIKVTEGEGLARGTLGKIDLHRTSMFLPGYRDRHSYTAEHPYWILEGFYCSRYGGNFEWAANELGRVFNDRIGEDNWDAFRSGLKNP